MAEAASLPIEEPLGAAHYRLSHCVGGCGPSRLELAVAAARRRTQVVEAWLSAAQRGQVVRVLDEEMERLTMGGILGIGADITECLRIARMIERHGEQFINRVYTADEVRYCQSRRQSTQHFAARWAAKEAVLKALGIGTRRGVAWTDIEIRKAPSGQPAVAVRGAIKDLVERLGVAEVLVSIAHCRTHATAYAIVIVPQSAR